MWDAKCPALVPRSLRLEGHQLEATKEDLVCVTSLFAKLRIRSSSSSAHASASRRVWTIPSPAIPLLIQQNLCDPLIPRITIPTILFPIPNPKQ